VAFEARPLPGAGCSEVKLSGGNRDKVALATEALRLGLVRALVGTAALLGEGWDSPCVNSLVLASFVGSYVLSNQMRGRAIRTDPDQPGKTANIWHLAAVEPPPEGGQAVSASDETRPAGSDFAALARRFDAFMGPVYGQPFIASGIRRASVVSPPFDRAGVERANRAMERLAADRGRLAAEWRGAADEASRPAEVVDAVAAPRPLPLSFAFPDVWLLAVVSGLMVWLPGQVVGAVARAAAAGRGPVAALALVASMAVYVVLGWAFYRFGRQIVVRLAPVRAATAIGEAALAALALTGAVTSPGAAVQVRPGALPGGVEWALTGASLRDKAVFAAAIEEVMSPIDNPRYLVVARRPLGLGLRPSTSFAAPAAVSTGTAAAAFKRELERRCGSFSVVYTRDAAGRALLLRCRRRSYLNRNARLVERSQRVAG
jgi:hypothetical protein